jgi:hypothetical protein
MSTQPAESPGRKVCEQCKQTFDETEGTEQDHYSLLDALFSPVMTGRKVFVCSACAARGSLGYRIAIRILGVIFALIVLLAVIGYLVRPK